MTLYIEPNHLKIVREILTPFNQEFYVFGSRSKGTQRPLSDLDIVSKIPVTKLQFSQINEQLEESNLPYKVDLVLWSDLEDAFKENIQKDLKPLC